MAPQQDCCVKYFRFDPKDYNTTFRIVKNISSDKVVLMANGDIFIEYYLDASIVNLFYLLQLHTPSPEDIDPPATPKELRRKRQTERAHLALIAFQIIGFLALAAYLLVQAISPN